MKAFNRLVAWVNYTINPRYWVMDYPYSKELDSEISRMLKNESFEFCDGYTALIGGKEIWVTNHPYASFRPRRLHARPSRKTIYFAMKKLEKEHPDAAKKAREEP